MLRKHQIKEVKALPSVKKAISLVEYQKKNLEGVIALLWQ